MNEIKVFAPASIANLSCGYDILGVCLDNIGDENTVRKTKKKGALPNCGGGVAEFCRWCCRKLKGGGGAEL